MLIYFDFTLVSSNESAKKFIPHSSDSVLHGLKKYFVRVYLLKNSSTATLGPTVSMLYY